MYKVVLALIESGARFQILAESLINDESKIWHPVDSFKMFSFEALVLLSSIASFLLIHWVGKDGDCWDFHTCNNLIWALIWLTDDILVFRKISLVGILSNNVFPFRNLANLFWATWIEPSRFWTVSSFFNLTFPRSWIPYLIFDWYRLSAIFFSLSLLMKLSSLLMRYSLELSDEISLLMWDSHFWSSSRMTPRSLVLDSWVTTWLPIVIVIGELENWMCLSRN